jgi:hypothetical protein
MGGRKEDDERKKERRMRNMKCVGEERAASKKAVGKRESDKNEVESCEVSKNGD